MRFALLGFLALFPISIFAVPLSLPGVNGSLPTGTNGNNSVNGSHSTNSSDTSLLPFKLLSIAALAVLDIYDNIVPNTQPDNQTEEIVEFSDLQKPALVSLAQAATGPGANCSVDLDVILPSFLYNTSNQVFAALTYLETIIDLGATTILNITSIPVNSSEKAIVFNALQTVTSMTTMEPFTKPQISSSEFDTLLLQFNPKCDPEFGIDTFVQQGSSLMTIPIFSNSFIVSANFSLTFSCPTPQCFCQVVNGNGTEAVVGPVNSADGTAMCPFKSTAINILYLTSDDTALPNDPLLRANSTNIVAGPAMVLSYPSK